MLNFDANYIQRQIRIYLITETYYFIAQLISKANLLYKCLLRLFFASEIQKVTLCSFWFVRGTFDFHLLLD